MKRQSDLSLTAVISIECEIPRHGHEPAIPNGSQVKLTMDASGAPLFSFLDSADSPKIITGGMKIRMDEAGTGIVIDRTWHADHSSLMNATMVRASRSNRPQLRGVTQELMYHVLFSRGLFWVRWYHLTEIEENEAR